MTPQLTEALADPDRDELTADEAHEYMEEQTLRYFGLSLAAFIAAAEANELPDHPALAHLILLTGAQSESC